MALDVPAAGSLRGLTRGPADLSPWSAALRETVREQAATYAARLILVARSFRETEAEPWREVRWAKATETVLADCPVAIRPGERLVGWHPNTQLDEVTRRELEAARAYLGSQRYWCAASEGHLALDFPTILRRGLDSLLTEIELRRNEVGPREPDGPDRRAFYRAAEISLTALQRFIERYRDLAAELAAATDDPIWCEELVTIAKTCGRIAHRPAHGFREAIQLAWFCYLGVTLENSEMHHCYNPGRLDQYLLPYLEEERGLDRCDEALVDDLLDQLLIKCNEFSGRSMSAVIVVIGGRKPDGSDATNELSSRILRSSCRTRMYFPGIDVDWHEDLPPEFMLDACRLLANGNGQPSFFNDQLVIDGLMRYGVPYEHAIDHLPSTCTETSIMGRCNPWVAWPYVNLPQALLDALHEAPRPATYEELLTAFERRLTAVADEAIRKGVEDQAVAARRRPFPLVSCFLDGCLESGRNISSGGARYNFLQPEAVGVGNVVDSLAAIRWLTVDDPRYTLDEFRAALAGDWAGHDELRRAVAGCPKYGNDDGWVNELFAWVASGWCDRIEGATNYLGGPIFPGFLGWVVWIDYGRKTAATPEGRRTGEPLANSLAPRSGVRLNGVPSTLLSATEFDHSRGLGGITFNLRFNAASLLADGGPERLRAMIETALGDLGLYMLQIDLASSATLRAAQQCPSEYEDLYVRIGGYLVPFTLLDPVAQEEVIARAELEL